MTGVEVVRAFAATLPETPGVYRMLDAAGKVLYVGKAKRLRRRVVSYTRTDGLVPRIRRMVERTRAMEATLTGSEGEALLLEANLIRRLKPLLTP